MFIRSVVMVLSLSLGLQAQAVEKKIVPPQKEDWSQWPVPSFNEQDTAALNGTWSTAPQEKRKLANSQEFTESNLKPDVIAFRQVYLSAETPDQLDALLVKADKEWSAYSPDLKYFTANLIVARSLRGLVWRLRPLFESGGLFSGNRATHGAAVMMLRQIASGIDTFFPTEQWEAGFAYITEPSSKMTKSQQFKSVRDFQKFLSTEFIPSLKVAAQRSSSLLTGKDIPTLVWDRKIVYGTASFSDGVKRYVGFGPAEIAFSTSLLYRGIHSALIFTAYNQDDLLNIMGRIGKRFGIDSALRTEDIGITDQQRVEIVNASVSRTGFLQLQDYNGSKYGTNAMSAAYEALKTSVQFQKKAYDYLKDSPSTETFVFNPLNFQPQSKPRLERAMNNMVAAVSGVADIRDPVTGDVIQMNLPDFYKKPYPNLAVLMATGFDSKSPAERSLKNEKGETLTFRNYRHGSAVAWNNQSWAKIIPSANSQSADYMKKAKRVIFYSLGTPIVAGQVSLFVR